MSHKVIGKIDWVLCKGYPQISGSDGVDQLTVKYTTTLEGLKYLPKYGDLFLGLKPGDEKEQLPGFEDGLLKNCRNMRLQGRNILPLDSGDVFEVTLTYGYDDDEIPDTDAVVKEEWEYDTQDYDVPLCRHDKYRWCWDHKLAAKPSAGSGVPSWFESATDDVLSSSDAAVYKWLKRDDKCPDGYAVIAAAKKQAESFRRGITTVQMVRRCASKTKLQASARFDYTIQTPKETFGKSGLWLRGGSKIRKNGKYWELTVSFLHTQDFDTDLYD